MILKEEFKKNMAALSLASTLLFTGCSSDENNEDLSSYYVLLSEGNAIIAYDDENFEFADFFSNFHSYVYANSNSVWTKDSDIKFIDIPFVIVEGTYEEANAIAATLTAENGTVIDFNATYYENLEGYSLTRKN